MQKLTVVLIALGTIGAGIATVLFWVGVGAEESRGGTWKIWTAADDRETGQHCDERAGIRRGGRS